MSNEEKISFKKIETYGFRLNILQAITLLSVLTSIFLWYSNRDEKQLIDGMSLHNQIRDLSTEFRTSHARDSVQARRVRLSDSIAMVQRRESDSVSLVGKFNSLKYFINADVHRLGVIERKLHINYVQEIKTDGPTGPVALRGVTN